MVTAVPLLVTLFLGTSFRNTVADSLDGRFRSLAALAVTHAPGIPGVFESKGLT
jgi:hypothetical protein